MKKKNIDNLLVDLQKLLKEYNASIEGVDNRVGLRILNENNVTIEAFVIGKLTGKELVKFLD